MTSSVIVYQDAEAVRSDLAAMAPVLADVLPTASEQQRFIRVVAKAIIENPKLMECTRASLVTSIHEAAQLGLEPTGLLGSAYLVPYREKVRLANGKESWVSEAKLIPGYRGLIDLARRSGDIRAIVADVWRQRDEFDYEKTRQPDPIRHRPFIPDPTAEPEERDRGPIAGAYMLAYLTSGIVQPEVMYADEVEAVRRRSRAADDGPWTTDYSEMCRKTVVRRGSKYLPLTPLFQRALELDEEAERGADAPEPTAARAPSKARAMLEARQARKKGETASDTGTDASGDPGASEAAPEGEGEYREVGPCDVDGCNLVEGHDGDHKP